MESGGWAKARAGGDRPSSEPRDGKERSSAERRPAQGPPGEEAVFGEAARGTSVVGGATAANLVLTALRTKALAVILGPEGTGVVSVLTAVLGFLGSVTSFGIATVGVREMANARGADADRPPNRIAKVVLQASLLTGTLGVIVQGGLAGVISRIAFGNASMTSSVAAVSLVLLFQSVTTGRQAYLQGTGQLSRFAWQAVGNSAAGGAASVLVVALGGRSAIAAALVAGAAAAALVSYLFARVPGVRTIRLPLSEFLAETAAMFKLGAFLSAGTAASLGASFCIAAIIGTQAGMRAVGLYSAAWNLSGMFVGFVLAAMGSDYLPRLVRATGNTQLLNVTVNEQVRVGLLIGVPGILAALLSAPILLRMFYSAEFAGAVVLLRWFVIGLLGRLLSWPLAFLLVASGAGSRFLVLEFIANATHVALVVVFLRYSGIAGLGTAFACLYLLYLLACVKFVCPLYGVRLRKDVLSLAAASAATIATISSISAATASVWSRTGCWIVFACVVAYVLRELRAKGMRFGGLNGSARRRAAEAETARQRGARKPDQT